MKPGIDFIGVSCVFACHDGAGHFLMAKRGVNARDEHGRWDFGAGKLEHGESWETAVTREVMEEYAATAKTIDFLTAGNALRATNGQTTHWIWLLFAVQVDPAEVCNNEPHKFDEIRWFTLDSLPNPLHSQIPGRPIEALKQYLKERSLVTV